MLDLDQIMHDLQAEFDTVCLQYNLDTNFIHFSIVPDKVRFAFNYKFLWSLQGMTTAEELADKIILIGTDSRVLMHTEAYTVFDNGKVFQWAFLTTERLWEFLYTYTCEGKFTDEELITYLKNALRHEVGHMITNQRMIDEFGIKEGAERTRQLMDQQDKIWNAYISANPDFGTSEEKMREAFTTYHSLPCEKAADEAVGLTAEDMIEPEVVFWRRSNHNV